MFPAAVFPMDEFTLKPTICSNYSLIVFALKAWQVYHHYEKFLEYISFHLGRGDGGSLTLAFATGEVGKREPEWIYLGLSV